MTGQEDHRQRCTVRETGTAAVQDSGKGIWLVKIIEADVHGTNGFYPAQVLERDGPKAFPAGTHYYIDHPARGEQGDARSLRDFAGVQLEDAFPSSGPQGRGLYARVQLLPTHRETVEATAPHSGVSINALAVREYDQNRDQFTVTELIEGLSVDFVSRAGAGGKLVAMTEGAREGSANMNQGAAAPPQNQAGIFTLSENDRSGLQKLFEAVQGVTQRLQSLEAKAAEKAPAGQGEPKTLNPGEVIAKLDNTQLSKLSRQRVAIAAAEPGADLDKLIKDATELETELSQALGTGGGQQDQANQGQQTGGTQDGTVDVSAQPAAAGTEGAQPSAAQRGQVVTTESATTGWASQIDAMFGGGL